MKKIILYFSFKQAADEIFTTVALPLYLTPLVLTFQWLPLLTVTEEVNLCKTIEMVITMTDY